MRADQIDTFEIPEEIGKELTNLLTTQVIREKLMTQVINEPDKYESLEKGLIPVIQRIDVLRNTITNDYVPEVYRSDKYSWNYDGYEIDGMLVSIVRN